ncbi:MAG: hypothetical protein M0P49_02510 [Bacilli bacterium]|nr:hypothetical protein [Bacilli bacterium]
MFFKKLTDLDITILSLAQCLYVRGLDSFNEMSEIGRNYWIDKYDQNLPKLVDDELNKGKTNKKWIKKALSAGKYYNQDMMNV